jgi:glycosyltransferase involved in cell wall biosynthesis
MACGVPVIVTDVSDNAYIVPDGRVGYVVPLGDAETMAERICRLLEDETTRVEMARAARKWVEQEFATSRLASKTAEVYEEWLARDVSGEHTRCGYASDQAGS